MIYSEELTMYIKTNLISSELISGGKEKGEKRRICVKACEVSRKKSTKLRNQLNHQKLPAFKLSGKYSSLPFHIISYQKMPAPLT